MFFLPYLFLQNHCLTIKHQTAQFYQKVGALKTEQQYKYIIQGHCFYINVPKVMLQASLS